MSLCLLQLAPEHSAAAATESFIFLHQYTFVLYMSRGGCENKIENFAN